MSKEFKKNSLNILVSLFAIIAAHLFDLGVLLFWVGGLLVLPAISVWYQFKYAVGAPFLRASVALVPWLVLCLLGIYMAMDVGHDGEKAMNTAFFQMPLYSALSGGFIVLIHHFYTSTKLNG